MTKTTVINAQSVSRMLMTRFATATGSAASSFSPGSGAQKHRVGKKSTRMIAGSDLPNCTELVQCLDTVEIVSPRSPETDRNRIA